MKAGIYNPYLDTLGGGERYTMAVATILAKNNYKVDVQWKDTKIKNELEDRFGIDLSDINFVPDIKRGDGYDVCFWVSDGSIPTLYSRKNLLHFQVPFKNVSGKNLLNKMKLFRINKIVCNSYFTKRIIDQEYGVESVVLYPPVSVESFKAKKKENVILSVARFSQLKQAKRQDVLIDSFKQFFDSGRRGWKLILAGGVEIGGKDYIERLEETSRHYPIKVMRSPKFRELKKLYATASFFWSAAGFGIDEEKEPDRVEHFGITTVEAMASGCIPLVYGAGGQKEIIVDGKNGFLWKSTQSLVGRTDQLVGDPKLTKKIAIEAKKDAFKYSYEKFEEKFISLF